LFGGFDVALPAFKGFDTPGATGLLFPFSFVTIACGACSGFHGLVCSGTTSKQIASEPHCRPIGYGAMLLEGLVAVIALATLMIAGAGAAGKAPGAVYGEGLGRFLTVIIGDNQLAFATTFGAMAFSTFVFDTLDVSTRLGRYIIQEILGWRTSAGAFAGTLVTVALPVYFVIFTPAGNWVKFWTLFGASNQLLAALSLLAITVWLHQSRRRIAYTLVPMLFVLVITLWALVKLVGANVAASGGFDVAMVNAAASAALIVLSIYIIVRAIIVVRAEQRPSLAMAE
ncbi:MAG: carbon starvation CstA family protein, partial [Thermoanaerobaculia bacterium]